MILSLLLVLKIKAEPYIKKGHCDEKAPHWNPEFRGNKIGYKLLNHIENWLYEKGYTKLGVDFESFNILGSNFWRKHFEMYSYTMVRRIDG